MPGKKRFIFPVGYCVYCEFRDNQLKNLNYSRSHTHACTDLYFLKNLVIHISSKLPYIWQPNLMSTSTSITKNKLTLNS